jgi:hypothetical protein
VAPLRVCYSPLSHARVGIEELSTRLYGVGALPTIRA